MLQFPKWKTFLVLLICAAGILFASPNFLSEEQQESLPGWLQPVNLGLDLQGGSQILLEVDIETGLKDQLNALVDIVRKTLSQNKIGYVNLAVRDNNVSFKIRKVEQVAEAKKLLERELPDVTVEINNQGHGRLSFTESSIKDRSRAMLQQSIEMVRRRIDEYGTTEPNIQQQGDDQILVQLPGVDDPARVRELLGKTAKMTFRLVHPDTHQLLTAGQVPSGYEKLQGTDQPPYFIVNKQILLSGEHLVSASLGRDDYGLPAVNFKFDSYGAGKFADITKKNKNRQLAIVLDNQVISAPRISGQIPTGSGIITGSFTQEQASDLAILMRAGALPAPLNVVEERTVGPDLGADSIAAGESATVFSIILVAIFMLLAYSFFGIVADIAVVFNIVLLVAIMSIIQATLTLPGIAGIALTIGMAVDANVLIYERIKEELRNGHKVASAIDAGYKRAIATIVDSNLTTLIGALLLFTFGSGAIRGFAVTLSIGILVSMFTAISLTRMIVVHWYRWRRPKKLAI